jgi:transcriptional regulator with XRE-family HTH domain
MTGSDIKKFRLEHNITGQSLASIAEVDRSTLSIWENGQYEPSFDFERRVVRAMNKIQHLVDFLRPIRVNFSNAADVRIWLKQLDEGGLPIHRAGQCGETQAITG